MLRNKLIFKIILIISVAIVVTIMSIAYVAYYFTKVHYSDATNERYSQLVSEVFSNIDEYLLERRRSVVLLADSHTPKHFLTEISVLGESPAHPVGGVIEDLDSFGMYRELWESVSFVDAEEIVRASSRTDMIGEKMAGLNIGQTSEILKGNPQVSDFIISSDLTTWKKRYVFPVERFGSQDGYDGMVVADLSLATLEKVLATIWHQIPENLVEFTKVTLVSSGGDILIQEGSSEHVEYKGSNNYYKTHFLPKHIPGSEVGFSEILADSTGKKISVFYKLVNGQKDFYGLTGGLFLEINSDRLYGTIIDVAIKPIAFMVPMIIVTGFVVLVWLYWIVVRPIRSFIKTISDIKGGKSQARAKIFSGDEIGQLARHFNDLADQLQQSNSVLEEKVRKRTEELSEANSGLEKQVLERTRKLNEMNLSLNERVLERTKELEKLRDSLEETVIKRTEELNATVEELKSSNQLMINRELKMIELKEEIVKLKSNQSGSKGQIS
ncbi:HAMP domain-containing protein [Candidatus Kaiserbacteria bacterium]|nr:HAMP domain-containing protein [Candidatus Kaiserbacteria bacterium]USN92215.1 MAG: HAMP domain-containing protein [Candidatus Nomurabacteria bacterium]